MNRISHSRFILFMFMFSFLFQIGCDENNFSTTPNEKCFEANNIPGLTGEFTKDGTCIYTHDIKVGKIDILFIIDNSKSMYAEQQKMADRFPTFIDSIWSMDFKIGIMTTDITKDPVKSGQFVTLSNGSKTISNTNGMSKSTISQIFSDSITREETLSCDLHNGTCPSGDVRGIYAANLAVNYNKTFFRPDAHTAIVVLSDADERVFGGNRSGFFLDPNWDTPESLVHSFSRLGKNKTFSVHSIIINPGDQTIPVSQRNTFELKQDFNCRNEQSNPLEGIIGYYGTRYYALSLPKNNLLEYGNLLRGTVGSICASDYGRELISISSNVKSNVKTIGLRCDPISLDVYESGNKDRKIPFTLISTNQVKLSGDVPVGLQITIKAECENVH